MGCLSSTTNPSEAVHTNSEMTRESESPRGFGTKVKQNYSKTHTKSQRSTKSTESASVNQDGKEDSRSSVSLSWHLDADLPDERKVEFQLKMSQKKSQIEEEAKQLKMLTMNTFEAQVSRQKAHAFVGLYDLFKHHSTNADKSKMDIDGVTEALKEFGMIIDNDRNLQKFVFSAFDIDNEGSIDYNDFMATLSSLIGTKNEESLLLLFQIFDIDQDGYLTTEDMARILLAQNQIAVVVTGHLDDVNANTVTLGKRQCLKLARRLITKYDGDEFKDEKISFDVFEAMMMNVTTEKMMIDNMTSGLVSIDGIETPQEMTDDVNVDVYQNKM